MTVTTQLTCRISCDVTKQKKKKKKTDFDTSHVQEIET